MLGALPHPNPCAPMIVCLCNRVGDRDIRHAVQVEGVRDFEQLKDWTQAAAASCCCGCCHDCAREVFEEACATAPANESSVAPVIQMTRA